MVTQLIKDGIDRRGHGSQTRLAEAVGVRVQTVNKWVKGQTVPDPDRWADIDRFFGWDEGSLALAAMRNHDLAAVPALPPLGPLSKADRLDVELWTDALFAELMMLVQELPSRDSVAEVLRFVRYIHERDSGGHPAATGAAAPAVRHLEAVAEGAEKGQGITEDRSKRRKPGRGRSVRPVDDPDEPAP